jgi:ammonia channel protein AmtB
VLYGYSLAFGDDVGGGLLGIPTELLGLSSLLEDTTGESGGLPTMAFVGFQAVFAIITVALVSGAVAERMKFGSWLVFAGVWATVVYFPVAHWVFDFSVGDHVGGWVANTLGAIDFAGGTAVHINAGAAALALALVLGTRRGFGTEAMRPHNLPLVMLGAVAGVVCALAVGLKYRLGYDDSLDVVGVHLVGGLWGTIAVGFFASAATTAGVDGLFYGGGVDQLWRQVVGALAVLVYSFVLTWIIGMVIQKTMGFRIKEEFEITGIDSIEHAETAYDFASLGGSSGASLSGQAHAEARNTEGVRA